MESLKVTSNYEFNPDTLDEVRKELNLNKNEINNMLDNLQDWIAKQEHFTKKDFSRRYLETCLIQAKGSVERTKTNLEKLCTLKTLLPTYFEKHNAKDFEDFSNFVIHGPVAKILKDNYRLYFVKLVSSDFDASALLEYYRYVILLNEYTRIHDYSFGTVCVVDCRDVNLLSFVAKMTNIVDLRNTMSIMMVGYGLRIKAIYVISESKTVDVFVTVLKQVLSKKVSERIKVVKTVEALHEFVDKENLPKDYGGGVNKTLKEINENWTNVISTKENVEFFKDIFQAKTDEKYRLSDRYNEEVLGMPGSFRTLSVD
ncbi:hypothetical protein PYW08_008022 [Mythimna loreyi]|uniref:Uncharacterized protein n=1 Tax=Mythimna loreyi TaxID=667449 RepID=A0ACC2QB64_9NEOP|nr:hypothetical protein PYW08_008022 [Mythimna loreyi]